MIAENDKKNVEKWDLGRVGEVITAVYLQKRGYRIVCRNYRCRFGEIDIIAEEEPGDTLCFIEVKTRSDIRRGRPCEAVTPAKLRRIRQAAFCFLRTRSTQEQPLRIDVAEVLYIGGKYYIRYTKNVS